MAASAIAGPSSLSVEVFQVSRHLFSTGTTVLYYVYDGAFNQARPLPESLVARHGIEPYPLAFQTSTLPSSSRAKNLVDGARVELAFHGCRPWVIPLYEPPNWGEMRESNSRDWSHNPVPKPFG